MNYSKSVKITSRGFLLISIISLLSVSLMALLDPQSVMNLVNVQLNNNDAMSSIRGVYGGVGITICLSLVYLMIKDANRGMIFISIFWGSYALSRILTWMVDGELGSFGKQWLIIESCLFFISLLIIMMNRNLRSSN